MKEDEDGEGEDEGDEEEEDKDGEEDESSAVTIKCLSAQTEFDLPAARPFDSASTLKGTDACRQVSAR